MAFSSMSRHRFFYDGLGGTSNSLFFFFPTFSSPIYACSQASTSNTDNNADYMLLSGVLAVMSFEITFLGNGVGADYRYF